jgi:hypothetical protein
MSEDSTDTATPQPGSQEWLDSVVEDVVDPGAAIIDPHHHLWPVGGSLPYGLDELLVDLASGHHVVDTVFVECGAAYREEGNRDLLTAALAEVQRGRTSATEALAMTE